MNRIRKYGVPLASAHRQKCRMMGRERDKISGYPLARCDSSPSIINSQECWDQPPRIRKRNQKRVAGDQRGTNKYPKEVNTMRHALRDCVTLKGLASALTDTGDHWTAWFRTATSDSAAHDFLSSKVERFSRFSVYGRQGSANGKRGLTETQGSLGICCFRCPGARQGFRH